MASSTANLGLVLPFQSEAVSVTTQNDNLTKIDNAVNGLQDGMAILANGNTHAAIASGQYVYVRNHSSLAEGLYKATTAIATNGTLSTNNLTADSSGGFNDLKAQIDTLSSNLWKQYGTNFNGDANTLVYNGAGYCNGASNTPTGAGNGTIIVFRASDIVTLQLYLPYNSTTIYRRFTSNSGGTWTAWA